MDARRALLERLMDYAGLFPPASHTLDVAVERFAAHQDHEAAWMLGRFVIPAARLPDLEPRLGRPWAAERPLRLSVLASLDEIDGVEAFAAARADVAVEALELPPPGGELDAWLGAVTMAMDAAGLAGRDAFVELPPGRDDEVLSAVAGQRAWPALGAKLRCGGVTAALVPPVDRVAAVLAGARDRGVRLKFTAGLHHPVRGMHATEGVPMHGFLNVYTAAMLAHTAGLDAADLRPIVEETDPAAFRLDADHLAWRDHTLSGREVAELRGARLAGYGSCSFSEPVADLRSLAILT